MSNLTTDWVINVTNAPVLSADPVMVTTERLLAVCAHMDASALRAAVLGLVTMFFLFVWMGRIRKRWLESKKLAGWVVFTDKLLMVFVAMQFVTIIVNLLRAG